MLRRVHFIRISMLAMLLGGPDGHGARMEGEPWFVPAGGNAYLTTSADGSRDRVDLQGIRKSGPVFAEVEGLVVKSAEKDLKLDFVKTPE